MSKKHSVFTHLNAPVVLNYISSIYLRGREDFFDFVIRNTLHYCVHIRTKGTGATCVEIATETKKYFRLKKYFRHAQF